jgi:hypothetical protein
MKYSNNEVLKINLEHFKKIISYMIEEETHPAISEIMINFYAEIEKFSLTLSNVKYSD